VYLFSPILWASPKKLAACFTHNKNPIHLGQEGFFHPPGWKLEVDAYDWLWHLLSTWSQGRGVRLLSDFSIESLGRRNPHDANNNKLTGSFFLKKKTTSG